MYINQNVVLNNIYYIQNTKTYTNSFYNNYNINIRTLTKLLKL